MAFQPKSLFDVELTASKETTDGTLEYTIKLLGFRTTKAGSPVQSFSLTS